MPTLKATRESLVEFSRRFTRVVHEVEDVAHDIVLSALRRGSPLDGEAFLRGAPGAARRHAAFLARSAARRRTREIFSTREQQASGELVTEGDVAHGAPLSALSATLRTTLYLLCSGLEKAELRVALGVTDAALRKRFQALRERAPLARPRLPAPFESPTHTQLRKSQVELLPRLAAVRAGGERRVLAASDPDGHGLIFAEELTTGPRAATSDASRASPRVHSKGSSCSTARSRTSRSSSS